MSYKPPHTQMLTLAYTEYRGTNMNCCRGNVKRPLHMNESCLNRAQFTFENIAFYFFFGNTTL